MFIPLPYQVTNQDTLYEFINDYPLGTLVFSVADQLDAIHTPFLLNCTNTEKTLQCHIAKANPLWQQCTNGQDVLIIFHGPNAYISPNFYPVKLETGHAVPTWNYSVVHVQGRLHIKHEYQWIVNLLENITHMHETSSQSTPWLMSDVPEEYIKKLINAVVGLEIEIGSIVGNFKLSQKECINDYNGIIDGLEKSNKEHGIAVSKQMCKAKMQ